MRALNVAALELSFEPPLARKPKRARREVFVTTECGTLLAGIAVRYPKGRGEVFEVPGALTVLNRPEYGETEHVLSELDRAAIMVRIREALRTRADPPGHPEREPAREKIVLLRKAWAARSGRRN